MLKSIINSNMELLYSNPTGFTWYKLPSYNEGYLCSAAGCAWIAFFHFLPTTGQIYPNSRFWPNDESERSEQIYSTEFAPLLNSIFLQQWPRQEPNVSFPSSNRHNPALLLIEKRALELCVRVISTPFKAVGCFQFAAMMCDWHLVATLLLFIRIRASVLLP